jgi:hypothetical protein
VNGAAAGVEAILSPRLEAHAHRIRVARRAGDEEVIFAEPERHPVVEHDA